jgi:hypothetical protein
VVKRSIGEKWLIEQLEAGACPVCAEHLLHMVHADNTAIM